MSLDDNKPYDEGARMSQKSDGTGRTVTNLTACVRRVMYGKNDKRDGVPFR